jgi:hypothetical protein
MNELAQQNAKLAAFTEEQQLQWMLAQAVQVARCRWPRPQQRHAHVKPTWNPNQCRMASSRCPVRGSNACAT